MKAVKKAADDVVQAHSTNHGLAFLALESFVVSFVAARAFATLNPTVIVQTGGIHFHHFWYGLVMIGVAGWLGIVYHKPKYLRLYAVVFGVGEGLLGDEIGLLLTFGNYDSELTFFFFIIAVALGSLAILFFRYRKEIEYDVTKLGVGERIVYLGVVVAGVSALAFAENLYLPALAMLAGGVILTAVGLLLLTRRE